MRKLTIAFLALFFAGSLWAQTAREEILNNICLSGSNYLAYPTPTKVLTPAPKDKKPFYISHYGRHGSRYLCDKEEYTKPLYILKKAETAGVLTPKGVELLNKVQLMSSESNNRIGELTELGALQHREIAERMFNRFPEVFAGDVTIDAKSTIVIRCILSMENELQVFAAKNPKLRIKHDASEHDMYYMNFDDKELTSKKWNDETKNYYSNWERDNLHPENFIRRIFNSESWVNDNVNKFDFYNHIFNLAGIVQNSEIRHKLSLYDLFDKDEIYSLWEHKNIGWFMTYASSTLNGGTQPFSQRNLLKKMIEEADSCIAINKPGATLRFGHETMVMPLTCLLNLNGNGNKLHPSQLTEKNWRNYKIFPMGCNIQIIFYRKNPKDKDVWIKVLLNEEEATLPIQPVQGSYYRWSDFRKYYTNILDSYEQ